MKIKRALILALIGFLSYNSSSQTYIKTNALYWAGLLPNVQVETYLGEHFTLQGEVNTSLWKEIGSNGYPMMFGQFMVGGRYYTKKSFDGFYTGIDFAYDLYEMSKWNYWGLSDEYIHVQNGVGYYIGVTLGYQISIGGRWNMDFFAGGGWHLGKYSIVKKYNDGTLEGVNGWNGSGEWMPMKLGVTFGLRLGGGKDK